MAVVRRCGYIDAKDGMVRIGSGFKKTCMMQMQNLTFYG